MSAASTASVTATRPAYAVAPPRPDGDELLDAAIDELAATTTGGELATMLRERRDQVVVLDEPGELLPPGAGGRWDPAAQRLYVLRSELEHPAGVTLLAHEAVHMRDAGSHAHAFGGAIVGVGRSLLDMAVAPLRGRNPVSAAVDGVRSAWQVPAEVDAYHLQARVAQELHLRADHLHHRDGEPRSREELRAWLLDHDLYRLSPTVRTTIGAGFAYLGGRATGQLANAAVARLAPHSWAGRHPGTVTAGALALWAGLLVQDHVVARRP